MGQNKRIEKDALGKKEIKAEAYYGIQSQRALENFPITHLHVDAELIKSLAIVKKSAAEANAAVSLLDDSLKQIIVKVCEEIISGKWHEEFVVDPIQGGAGTSLNMNANEVIANRALELLHEEKGNYSIISPNTHVNMSQSTNDVVPTAVRIAILKRIEKLEIVFKRMLDTFLKKEEEFSSVLKMGRTHLQDAIPIRLGQEFSAYYAMLARHLERIQRAKEGLYEVNMGATAVGTGLNAELEYIKIVVERLSKNSQLPLYGAKNLVDATQNTDAYVELSQTLKATMISMSKISNDLRLMASGPRTGFQELYLPARQPGSSIMPGKINPVMLEVVNQVAFQVMGNDHTIALASEAGQFELNVMEPVLVFNLLQSLEIMTNVFDVFDQYCLQGIKANKEKMEEDVERSIGLITAINPHVGYELATEIAQEALETNRNIREICLERNIFTEEQLNKILDCFEMTEPGISGK